MAILEVFFFLLFFILSLSSFITSFSLQPLPHLTSPLLTSPLLSSPLLLPHHHLSLAPIHTYSASKGTLGSSWMATSFSFPLMLSSHSAVACSVRAEQAPGSPPEASARRSPPLPAHFREPSEWSAIVLAVIWWPHSTGRQSQEPGASTPSPHLTGYVETLLIFFFFFC